MHDTDCDGYRMHSGTVSRENWQGHWLFRAVCAAESCDWTGQHMFGNELDARREAGKHSFHEPCPGTCRETA